jgi:hypothetical protein
MKELVRLSVFLGFLVLGARVALAEPRALRSRVNLLLGYVLCVSAAVGVAQRDVWPFSAYRIFYDSKPAGYVFERLTLRVVGVGGGECEVDPGFGSPVTLPTLQVWFERTYPQLSAPERERAMAFLLARLRDAAARTMPGRDAGVGRVLGWLAAPPHWGLYAVSTSDDFLRCVPYVGLRLYRDEWRPSETFLDARRVARHLISEYRSQ